MGGLFSSEPVWTIFNPSPKLRKVVGRPMTACHMQGQFVCWDGPAFQTARANCERT